MKIMAVIVGWGDTHLVADALIGGVVNYGRPSDERLRMRDLWIRRLLNVIHVCLFGGL